MPEPTALPLRLLADIGGTNARFALARPGQPASAQRTLAVAEYPTLGAAAKAYLAATQPDASPRQAAFAVACPVLGDQVVLTNSPWSFSVDALRRELGLERLEVVNDFAALALAVPHLSADDLRVLAPGATRGEPSRPAPIAVLGPGTGLGMATLVPAPSVAGVGGWQVLTGEGGHATLPAADEYDALVLGALRRRFGHVSAERVLSGSGLAHLHAALEELDGLPPSHDDPAEITRHAQDGTCPHCAEAVSLFCALLGTVAGNFALTVGALGGVYLAGGILPRLGELFDQARFLERFRAKGRFAEYLTPIPVAIITHPYPAFLGLAALLDR